MKTLFKPLLCLFVLCMVSSCTEEEPLKDWSDQQKYFPMIDGAKYIYKEYYKAPSDSIDVVYNYEATFDGESNSLDFFDGTEFRKALWLINNENRLERVVGEEIALNYDFIGCTSDSVEIYRGTDQSTTINTFQFCGDQRTDSALNYISTKSIKTVRISIDGNGTRYISERYYGYDVGMLYEKTVRLRASDSSITSIRETILQSHTF